MPGGVLGREPRLTLRLLLIALPLSLLMGWLVGVVLLHGVNLWLLAVLAAIVMPLDLAPAAFVRDRRIPERLRQVLTAESGLTDGIVAPVFLFCLAAATAAGNEALADAAIDAGPARVLHRQCRGVSRLACRSRTWAGSACLAGRRGRGQRRSERRSFVLAVLRVLHRGPLLVVVRIGVCPAGAVGEWVGEVAGGPAGGWGVEGVGAFAGALDEAQPGPFRELGQQVVLGDLQLLREFEAVPVVSGFAEQDRGDPVAAGHRAWPGWPDQCGRPVPERWAAPGQRRRVERRGAHQDVDRGDAWSSGSGRPSSRLR